MCVKPRKLPKTVVQLTQKSQKNYKIERKKFHQIMQKINRKNRYFSQNLRNILDRFTQEKKLNFSQPLVARLHMFAPLHGCGARNILHVWPGPVLEILGEGARRAAWSLGAGWSAWIFWSGTELQNVTAPGHPLQLCSGRELALGEEWLSLGPSYCRHSFALAEPVLKLSIPKGFLGNADNKH